MPMTFTWTGRNEADRLTEIRWRCYGATADDRKAFRDHVDIGRMVDGDACIATLDGDDVGTATSLSTHMHLRGKRLACQGVAWVGTSKSHRRRKVDEQGIASRVMQETIQKARERGEVVSALMPFRASFYEHFGYGVVEKRLVWTIPLSLLPRESSGCWRFGNAADKPAMLACRGRQSLTGNCDIDTDDRALEEWFEGLKDKAQLFVDDCDGQISAYAWVKTSAENGQKIATLIQPSWDSPPSFRSILGFLGSLRDQYSLGRLETPTLLPLNWLLSERQLPHRPVDHPAASCDLITRMQVRILDHAKFLTGQRVAPDAKGRIVVGIRETEGTTSVVAVEIAKGVIHAAASSETPDALMSDITWAAIACGELRATSAGISELVDVKKPGALRTLDHLADGHPPFCCEYF